MSRKPILSVDFDGVLHSYTSKWEASDKIPDPPVPGAIAFLREAVNHFRVCIYSTRSATYAGRTAMQQWLARSAHEEEEGPVWLHLIEWPDKKPPALVTLDDRAVLFEGEFPSMDFLLSFKPWNKR